MTGRAFAQQTSGIMEPIDVTLVPDAIHNPNEPRHFMKLVPDATRTASVDGVTIARSSNAVVVKEVGRGVYDPVVYFPRVDVEMERLLPIETTTHCPLKGDTTYFDVTVDGRRLAEAAWSYTNTIDVAESLRDIVAFDARQVTVA